jgi:hypothetical protein
MSLSRHKIVVSTLEHTFESIENPKKLKNPEIIQKPRLLYKRSMVGEKYIEIKIFL